MRLRDGAVWPVGSRSQAIYICIYVAHSRAQDLSHPFLFLGPRILFNARVCNSIGIEFLV